MTTLEKRRKKIVKCVECDGCGKKSIKVTCNYCEGTGWVSSFLGREERRCSYCDDGQRYEKQGNCEKCNGSGKSFVYEYYKDCNHCDGSGKYIKNVPYQIDYYSWTEYKVITDHVCVFCEGTGKLWM